MSLHYYWVVLKVFLWDYYQKQPPEVFLEKRVLKNAANLQENTHAKV